MNKTKRILSLLLAVLMIFAVAAQLVACDNNPDDGGNTDDSGDNGNTGSEKATYVVTVKTEGGIAPSKDITVYICDPDGDIKGFKNLDDSGKAVFEIAPSPDYTVKLTNVPEGYICAEEYPLGGTGATITLHSRIISDESLAGVTYNLGSIVRDMTLTAPDGTKVKLSDVLKTKKAVMLNFWYKGCSPCVSEFPEMNEAYNKYKDKIEILAINPFDTSSEVAQFKSSYYEFPIDFPMFSVLDTELAALPDAYGVPGYPTTIMIDRYGMMSLFHISPMTQTNFENMFDHYSSDNYKQGLYNSVEELIPAQKPNVSAPSSEEIAGVVNNGNVNAEYLPEAGTSDAEYSWPFIVTEKNGVSCIAPSNGLKKVHSSYAIMHAKVTLKEGEAFVFDYLSAGTDTLYVLVDGKDILQISGVNSDWKEACAWVALEDGTYDIVFTYVKDDSDKADFGNNSQYDDVYLKNFRVMDKSEVKPASYIFRFAATNLNSTKDDYLDYVEVFLNPKDGYYHVGSADGPILVARLIANTPFSDIMGIDSVSAILYDDYEEGGFMVDGKDRTKSFLTYCNYASHSKVYTYCSVTEELASYLKVLVKEYGFATHDKTWLQLCAYYDAYGFDENGNPAPELEDICIGLSAHSAYTAVLGKDNKVEYDGTGMLPRGFLYEFIPQTSGAYRITSLNAPEAVEGWIFIGSDEEWLEVEDRRILYTSAEVGERICEEMLTVNEKGEIALDDKNVTIVAYMEAGTPYYIDFAFNDMYGVGSFDFEIKKLGDTYDYFISASPGPFTAEILPGETFGDIIALSIDTVLGDDGYYHHKLENGSLGSIVYADFSMVTTIFTENSILRTLESHPYAFNFSVTEDDFKAITAWENANKDVDTLKEIWGEDFEANWAKYKMDDIIIGKYHGKGADYTAELKSYVDKMINDENAPMELNGCVAVDERLAEILQDIVGKYTFENVAGAWKKLCYYYEYLGR